ncbi:hypothetical protein TNCV_3683021 [Trichonephila clavipes]|nr:hypothetical protein TNCV_3683021 [Trichonephila clavipes]
MLNTTVLKYIMHEYKELVVATVACWSWSRACSRYVMSSIPSNVEDPPFREAVHVKYVERQSLLFGRVCVAAVADWYRYRIVTFLFTSSSPVPLKPAV